MTEFTDTDNTQTRLDKLRAVASTDGAHYMREGYKNIAMNCLTCFTLLSDCVARADGHTTGVALKVPSEPSLQCRHRTAPPGAVAVGTMEPAAAATTQLGVAVMCDRTTHIEDERVLV